MRIVCLPRHPAVAYLFLVRRQLAHTKEWHPVSVPLPRLSLAWLAHLSGLRSPISLPVGGRPCRRRFHGYSLLLGISLSAPALFPDGYCLSSVLLPWFAFFSSSRQPADPPDRIGANIHKTCFSTLCGAGATSVARYSVRSPFAVIATSSLFHSLTQNMALGGVAKLPISFAIIAIAPV